MTIRKAENKDTAKVLALLHQVLEVHADLRPDLFISGTTKYTDEELHTIFADEKTPVYVAVDENDTVLGYAFCVLEEPVPSNNLHPHRTLYIDDICVDEKYRRHGVGKKLYDFVIQYAKEEECFNVTLNVWDKNPDAKAFYESMGMKVQKVCMEVVL